MVEFSAAIDDVVVVALAVLGFALFRQGGDPLSPLFQLGVAVGGGALLGVVTWLFLGGLASEDERLLLGLAMLAFTSGFASWLLTSPAAVTAIAAVVVANLPGGRISQLFLAVRRVERPAVVILMTAIGFRIVGPLSWMVVPLVVVMTALRLGAKYGAGELVTGPIAGAPGLAASRGWAHGLVPQGTLGLMLALSFFDVWGDEIARSVLAAVAIASLINELVAPLLLGAHAARAPRARRGARAASGGRGMRWLDRILYRLLPFGLCLGLLAMLRYGQLGVAGQGTKSTTVALGFLLIGAFISGKAAARFGMPRISGYLMIGILAGPYASGLLTKDMLAAGKMVEGLAVALIALTAGGEIRLPWVRKQAGRLAAMTVCQIVLIGGAIFGTMMLLRPLFPFMPDDDLEAAIIALVFGAIAVSPAT